MSPFVLNIIGISNVVFSPGSSFFGLKLAKFVIEMEIPHIAVADRKLIASLASSRHRREEGLFVAEGWKCVSELLPHFACRWIVATDAWLAGNGAAIPRVARVLKARNDEMERISSRSEEHTSELQSR